jgi:hypothetical protein
VSDDAVTAAHLARMADVSVHTVRRDCASGRIKGAKLVGKTWSIPPASADEYARTREPYDTLRRSGDALRHPPTVNRFRPEP